MRQLAPALVVLLAAAPAAAAAQQVTVFTDLAAFQAFTLDAGTDRFDDLAPGVARSPLARTAGAFGYTVSANTTDLFVTGPAGDGWLSANTATDVITFTGFSRPVRGVGALFFGTDAAGLFRPLTSLTVRATTAGGATVTRTIANATAASFLGFAADVDITALAVEVVTPAGDLAWPTVNNFVVAATVVPEPGTGALLAAGALALAAAGRRLRRPPGA